MSFPPYPSYAAKIEWFGPVPTDWKIEKFRHVFQESSEKIENKAIGSMLSVSGYRGVEIKIYDDENRRRLDEELVGYRIVRRGQLVINTMWLNYAGLGVSEYEGHVSPAYRSYSFTAPLHKKFVHYLMRSSIYVQGYTCLLTGIRPNSLQISRDDLMDFPVVRPPQLDQERIASFLNRETSKIDALIAEQTRLIELLKEKRQAVISHAVTKGLNPDAPTKDSGVEWLGKVPAHWLSGPLKRFLDVLSGYAFNSAGFSANPEDAPLLRGVNIGVGKVRWNDTVYWPRTEGDRLDEWALCVGDVVLGMDRPWINEGLRIAQLTDQDVPCLLLQRVAALRPTRHLLPEYLMLLLENEAFYHHCFPEMTGVSVPHISPGQIGSFSVVFPPPDEQAAIVARLVKSMAMTTQLVEDAKKAIALLEERRSALISAAVTGKIDVRGQVPEQSEAA